jgi:DNA repair photolyase
LRIKRESWGDFVDIRTNIPIILSKELKKKKQGVVGISTVTDPYQPVEKKYNITRYCLEQLLNYDFPISVQTKSSLVLRDIDLISEFSEAEVMMSIATLNDNERRLLEPFSSSVNDRLKALKEYSKAGVKTSVFFGPVYPTINPEDIPLIINRFLEYGAQKIMIDKLNIRPGIEKAVKDRLMAHKWKVPSLSNINISDTLRYQQIRNTMKKIGEQEGICVVDAF